ncbi:FkbM family methyltransferase [Haloferula sargassicola]|uniref:Methyltransferase FkbM domain-containing protein n=1 Tax=Haloferula sargassicola TaxID=490096 RepID=A0ABP9UJC8_9BACT
MKPSPYKRFEKAFKSAYLKPLTLLRYGTLKPTRARLHGSPHWIYIDAGDPCAIKKVVEEPLRGKVSDNLAFWRDFIAHLKPTLIVDVGLNYGECLFGADYPEDTRMFGFEANPRLIPHLEKSRDGHPAGERMTITHCLVSDAPADGVPFLVNPDWSGSSSAVKELNDRPEALEFRLPARPVDSVVPPEQADGATLLFKMDIEGYESRALKGFVGTFSKAARAVGFIEFDGQYIRWAGEDPDDYLNWLQQHFRTYRVVSAKHKKLAEVTCFADVPKLHGDPNRVHTDLVLVSHATPDGWLAPGWSLTA